MKAQERNFPVPCVSVLIPAYNARKYVMNAIQSVCQQSFEDIEIVVIDDGSADGTRDLLQQLAVLDSRVQIRSRSNTGYTRALIEGLSLCKAPLIARMDADDESFPQRLEKQFAYLSAHPECVVVGSQALLIDDEGRPLYSSRRPLDHEAIDQAHLEGRTGILFHSGTMFRRAAYDRVGGYRTGYEPAEDFDLWLRLAEVGSIANLPDTLLKYRVHHNSVCFKRRTEQIAAVRAGLADAFARRKIHRQIPSIDVPDGDGWKQMQGWVRASLRAGHLATARHYASRCLQSHPARVRSWIYFAAAYLWSACYPFLSLVRSSN